MKRPVFYNEVMIIKYFWYSVRPDDAPVLAETYCSQIILYYKHSLL
jgi:hypothetical protein